MYYCKIGIPGSGLTNQVISLISGIIIAYNNKHKVLVVDHFSNDVFNPNYTPISRIFNIEKINKFLKENYDIIIVDKYHANFELQSIKYGTSDTKIDIMNEILPNSVCINSLFINSLDARRRSEAADPARIRTRPNTHISRHSHINTHTYINTHTHIHTLYRRTTA